MTRKTAVGLTVLAVVLVGFLARDASTAPTLTAQDHAEINQLYALQLRRRHAGRRRLLYARTFTEDGEFDSARRNRRGDVRSFASWPGRAAAGTRARAATALVARTDEHPDRADRRRGAGHRLPAPGERGYSGRTGDNRPRSLYRRDRQDFGGLLFKTRAYHPEDFPTDLRLTAQ